MGMNYNTGKTEATLTQDIDNTTPIPVFAGIPTTATTVLITTGTGSQALTTTPTTLFTPTGGKKFYLLGIDVITVTINQLPITDNSVVKMMVACPAGGVGKATVNYDVPIEFATNFQMRTPSGGGTVYFTAWGYEI